MILPLVKEYNIDTTDPHKAYRDKVYEDCVQAEISKGKTREQVV